MMIVYPYYRFAGNTAKQTGNNLRPIRRIKVQVEGLHPTLQLFRRFEPVKLLICLSTFMSSLRSIDKSDGMALCVFPYHPSEDAKKVYYAEVNPGKATSPLEAMWPCNVYALLRSHETTDGSTSRRIVTKTKLALPHKTRLCASTSLQEVRQSSHLHRRRRGNHRRSWQQTLCSHSPSQRRTPFLFSMAG